MAEVTVRVAGANGDGIESTGEMLARIMMRAGLYVFAYRSYQSIIRGGHVWYQIRASNKEVHSFGDKADILLAINQDAITHQLSHIKDNALIIYDGKKINVDNLKGSSYKLVDVPMLDIAIKNGGDPILRNAVGIGAVLKITGISLDIFNAYVKEKFGRKGNDVVNNNINCASEGAALAEQVFTIESPNVKSYLINGNEALAMGAYAANCRFYAAYPMTPATSILQWFASHADHKIVVKQTEDELAAINTTIGAAVTGVRAMCGTSGGGFSLMVEALGFASMIEAPIVVAESDRTGPSTGLPTKTEQADLLFLMHASQGEAPRIVVAPRSVEECFEIGKEAFNLADRYQCPVLVMLDLYLSEQLKGVAKPNLEAEIDRGKIAKEPTGEKFKRYMFTDDGVSPRSLPGTAGLEYVAGSDEHDEYGWLVSDYYAGIDKYVDIRKRMHEKRMKKIETMIANEKGKFVPKIEKEGDFYIVTFGSTSEPAREACEILKAQGLNVGLITFNYIMPMDKQETIRLLKDKKLINVEYNYTNQLAYVIRANTGISIDHSVNKYDGEAITAEEISSKVAEIIKRW
ncbi:MAG: 2-oxoacid:acceptor oxidoreductase subunit alpha [Candidatus Micrarchaeia archaeon]